MQLSLSRSVPQGITFPAVFLFPNEKPFLPDLAPVCDRVDLLCRAGGKKPSSFCVSSPDGWEDGSKTNDAFGEMIFTHFGLSGPIILSLSRQIVQGLQAGHPIEIAIDFKLALDHPTLDRRLLREIRKQGRKQFSTLLTGLLPSTLVPVCVEQTRIPWEKELNQLTADDQKTLRMWLKENFRFQITRHRGFH